MSREIDERVVQMKFENGQFEKNIQTSIHSLEELKKGMDFQDAAKGFNKIDDASKINFDPITKSIQQINSHFNLMGVMALNVMNRISNRAIDTGEKLLKSLTIDQLTPGWTKYEDKTTAVQTIMAATAEQFSDTATQMAIVSDQLDQLNWFTDETSYKFTDMVSNISKFTSNNIDLQTSVVAMQGIANWAAKSGANANEASRAMYNLSQALASGAVTKIDWKSIENANMSTMEFKNTAIQTAIELKLLKKVGEDSFQTLNGKVGNTVQLFGDLMSTKWFTSDVLIKTLNKYGVAVDILREATEKYDTTASTMIRDVEKYTKVLSEARGEAQKLGKSEADTLAYVNSKTSGVIQSLAEKWHTTFEDAKETLEQFDDEVVQFSLTAFKYGQEAKTFAEAIGSATDAVSTKWMKTFELIFGNYEEAKQLWTNVANTLYDIFAASGDARNDLLSEWREQGGQKYFTDAIYAGLAAILNILTPIKAAWTAVFGTMSAEQLVKLTKRLRDFLVRLSASEETMIKLARTFRGLFSVLDLIRYVIGELVSGALWGFQRIMAELGIDVGEVAASAGDLLYFFTQWIKQSGIIRKAINLVVNVIVAAIQSVKAFIVALSEWRPAQIAVEKFRNLAVAAFGVIGNAVYVLVDVLFWLFQQFQNFHLPNSFEEVGEFFRNLAAKVVDSLKKIGIESEAVGTGFRVLGAIVNTTIGTIAGVFGIAAQGVSAALGLINRSMTEVDWAGIFLAAFGVATIALLWKFITVLNSFAQSLANVTGVGKSAKKAFDAIAGYFNELKANIQTNNLLKTAIAITALAVACGLLANLPWGGVIVSGIAIIGIAFAVTKLTQAFDKWSQTMGSADAKAFASMATFVLSIAAALVLITAALNNVNIDENLGKRIAVLMGSLTALVVASIAFTVFAKPIEIGAKTLVGIAASIWIMINALKSIKPEDSRSILAALPAVSALMLVMAYLTKLMQTTKSVTSVAGNAKVTSKSGSGFASILGLVVGLHLMIAAIKSLSNMRADEAVKGILFLVPLVLAVKTLLKYIAETTKDAKSGGQAVFYISAAINLLYFAIKNLSSMKVGEVVKGTTIVAALMALCAGLVYVSKFAGQYAAKAGLMILEIAGALAVIQLVIKTLGRLDFATAFKGTAAVSVLILAFGQMLKSMNSAFTADDKGLKALINVTIIMGIISALVLALTWLDPLGALEVCVGLGIMFKALGATIETLKFAEDVKMDGALKLLGFIGILGAIIGGLSLITDWKGALAITGGMSMIFIALGAMMKIANKTSGGLTDKKLAPMKAMVDELAVVVAALAGVSWLIKIMGGLDYGVFWSLIGGLTAIMTAYGLMTGIMGSMKGKPTEANLKPFLTIIDHLALIVGALGLLSTFPDMDWTAILAMTTGMSEVLVAIGFAMKIMSGVKIPENLGSINSLILMVGAITAIMGIIAGYAAERGSDISGVIDMAKAMGILLLALGGSVKIMNGTTFKMDPKTLVTLGLLVAGLGAILAMFGNTWSVHPGGLIPMAVAMSTLLIGLSASALILSNIRAGGFIGGAVEAIGIILLIISGMGVIIGALGALQEQFGGKLSNWLADGANMMIDLGKGIGGFVGGIISGFAAGLTSGFIDAATNISTGMEKLLPFFSYLENDMPDNILELGQRLYDTVTMIANPTFKSALNMSKDTAKAMTDNGSNLETIFTTFGSALKAFSDASQGIDLETVTNAIQAGAQLSTLEAGLPKKGGLLNTLLGEDDLASFGERIRQLGSFLYTFSVYGGMIDKTGMDIAVDASQKLQQLESKLPAKDGALQAFFGQDGFDKFGSRLATYGTALVSFSAAVSGEDGNGGINTAAINLAITATTQLSKIEAGLSNGSTLIGGFFFGDSDLKKFGNRLVDYGTALVTFSNTVKGYGDVGGIDLIAIANAIIATKDLSELESNLNTHGGWDAFWNGDNTFGKFGSNLSSLGTALVKFSNDVVRIDWTKITIATTFIETLTSLDKLEDASTRTLTVTKNLLKELLEAIRAQHQPIYDDARDMAYWLADGFAEGIVDYQSLVLDTVRTLATQVISVMNAVFKIHSPSVVMNEMGHWIVKGLGEGITEDMSAEEAAEKKAQDIISAFQSGLNKMSTKLDISNLEYELWSRTDGAGASDAEVKAKQLDLEVEKLKSKAQEVSMMRTAMNAVLETAGEDSDAYQTAYKNYLQSQIDMYDQQAVVDELQKTNVQETNKNHNEQVKYFVQVMNDNREMFEAMGKTEEELRQWSAEVVGADFARQMRINDYMLEQKEAFDELGLSMAQRTAEAEKALGYDIPKEVKGTLYNTTEIIAQAMEDTSYTLEEAVAKSTAKSVAKGISNGVGAGIQAPDYEEMMKKAGEQIKIPEIDIPGLDKLESALDFWNDPSGMVENIQNFFTGDNGILGAFNTHAKPVTDAVTNWASNLGESIFGTEQLDKWKDGAKKWLGRDGVKGGLEDGETLDGVAEGAKNVTWTAVDAMNKRAASGANSTVFEDMGKIVDQEYTKGMTNPAELTKVSAGSTTVETVSLSPLAEAATKSAAIGENVSLGFASGITAKTKEVVDAAKAVATAANNAFEKTLKVESPSKVTRRIGQFVSEGLAIGMTDRTDYVENSAEHLANSTISALDYAKDLINEVITNDDDFSPTITPVLDLDSLTQEAKGIPNLLNRDTRLNVSATARRASLIQSELETNGQNGSSGTSQTTYSFTQNNYSPKALNRVELYRQTQNQFAQLKGATKVR